MIVMEQDLRGTVPTTNTRFRRQELARLRQLRRAGTPNFRGLGDVEAVGVSSYDAPTAFPSGGGPAPSDTGLFDQGGDPGSGTFGGGFLSEWGVPAAAGIGAAALGLLIARAATKKRRR